MAGGKLVGLAVKWETAGISEEKVAGSGTTPVTGWFYLCHH